MLKEQILKLQTSQSFPSISIMLPTHRNFLDTEKDKIVLKNLVKECETKLKLKINKREVDFFVEKIQNVISQIDYHHLLDGLGIFVNRAEDFLFTFPFKVPKLAVVDDTFVTKFLIKNLNRRIQYWVLSLAEKPTRLYEGLDASLVEVFGSGFPVDIDEVIDLHPERLKHIYESFQSEKSRQFIRYVDSQFTEFKKESNLPVVIAGAKKTISAFSESADRKDIIGTIFGNFDQSNIKQLAKSAYEIAFNDRKRIREAALERFESDFTRGKACMGLLESWMLANQGRVKSLLVEENYHQPARFENNIPIFINKSEGPYEIDDLVDELIEVVYRMKGDVFFYEENKLQRFQKVGAVLRY